MKNVHWVFVKYIELPESRESIESLDASLRCVKQGFRIGQQVGSQ